MGHTLNRRDVLKAAGGAAAMAAAGPLVGTSVAMGQPEQRPPAQDEMPQTYGTQMGWNGQKYVLPPLPYDYDALDPELSERILRIHHETHHQGYVDGLNKALQQLQQARADGDWQWVRALSRSVAYNGSGHVNHTIFWGSMAPGGAEMPDELARMARRDFGSVDGMKTHFAAASKAVMASGWGVLAYEPMADKLIVLQAEKHQNQTMWGVVPLLICDVWEHAYYLQYQSDRGEWVDNFMKIANWPYAARRLAEVRPQA